MKLASGRTEGGAPTLPRRSSLPLTAAVGALAAIAARVLLVRVLLLKLRRDVRALNTGAYEPVLSNYADDAVLRFNEGPHRWSGEHRGKPAIARFLRNYVAAGLHGDISNLLIEGRPWDMTLVARFDDHAHDPAGGEIYRNRVILLARIRWGRIVWQEDFYADTQPIVALERRLAELGVPPCE
jgi:ketosteroid isomerase-like protein